MALGVTCLSDFSSYQMQFVAFNPVYPASVFLFPFLDTDYFITIPDHKWLQGSNDKIQ